MRYSQGGCKKCGGCQCQEYGCKHNGCIRPIKPECPYEAVIPLVTVEDKSSLKNLADCFVHVTNINTTFYIDDKHRMTITWAGPIENEADPSWTEEDWNEHVLNNPLGLRNQFAYFKMFNSDTGKYVIGTFYYDKTGRVYFAGEFEEIVGE
jgi:hypothetical protein